MAVGIVLSALAIRAIIPIGYMPGSLLDGEFMVLCPVASTGTLALLQAESSHEHHRDNNDQGGQSTVEICPIGSALFFDAISALDAPENVLRQRQQPPVYVTFDPRLPSTTRPYPTRGPPQA